MNIIKMHPKIKNLISLSSKKILGEMSGNYGHDQIVRKYVGIPKWLPFNVRIQHGLYTEVIPDLYHTTPLMLVWNKRIAEKWMEYSDIPVHILGAPFVLYRRMHNITPAVNARGTIVFPSHSTTAVKSVYNFDEYVEALNHLPDMYKPVTVCLHWRDVDTQKQYFEDHGLKVVTAGHSRQGGTGFVDNFYRLLSSHKYSSSNVIGSYTFYSVEMGIPFFLYGPKTTLKRIGTDEHIKQESNYRKEILNPLFSDVTPTITETQRELVLKEVGVDDAIELKNLRKLLFITFQKDIKNYPVRSWGLLVRGFQRLLFSTISSPNRLSDKRNQDNMGLL